MKKGAKSAVCFIVAALMLLQFAGCTDNSGDISPDTSGSVPENTEEILTSGVATEESSADETTVAEISTGEETTDIKSMKKEYSTLNYENVKAMWLSQFDLNSVYCTGGAQRSESSYRTLIKNILGYVAENGFNTVIVQVRPNADSMYPSDVYPASYYVVGSYGKNHTYDPFAILIEEAHALELSVQAWINPLRCMTSTQITSVNKRYKIREWYNDKSTNGTYIVLKGSNYYLNPAYEEVRKLIIDGAAEILANYEIDGLHMDDYFYPTTDSSFDSAAYTEYKKSGGRLALDAWRRNNLNLLVSGLYSTVKSAGEDIIFGISPAGNINTVYNSQYADVYTWCSEPGYIDYICPQVYFGLEHQTYDFKKVSETFQSIIKTDSVKLIIGMTLGKAKSKTDQYAGTGKNEWAEHDDILKRCLEYTENLEKCTGVAYFCLQYFRNPVTGAEETATAAERANFIPLLKEIKWNGADPDTKQ